MKCFWKNWRNKEIGWFIAILFYITPAFILSTTNPQIINSTPNIKLNLNKINPILKRIGVVKETLLPKQNSNNYKKYFYNEIDQQKRIGVVKERLYVTRITKAIIPIIEQKDKPFFIITFVDLSKFLKLFIIFLIICITYK